MPNRSDVLAALRHYASQHSQANAHALMLESGGVDSLAELMEVPAKWPAVIAATKSKGVSDSHAGADHGSGKALDPCRIYAKWNAPRERQRDDDGS